MGSRVITPEDVLESLVNDGTIDAIRLKIINQLKANNKRVLMESIHKSKAEKAREKTSSDRFEAKLAKSKASRERKIARREERLAQGPGERASAAPPLAQPAEASKKAKK